MKPFIQTYSGNAVSVLEIKPEDINPHEIPAVLARMCRFGGHIPRFYSVAQHSVIVESLVEDPKLKLPALLHDAHEVYTGFGDVARPMKEIVGTIQALERIVDGAIAERFGFDQKLFYHEEIKRADDMALAAEQDQLLVECVRPWGQDLPRNYDLIILPLPTIEQAQLSFSERLIELWISK